MPDIKIKICGIFERGDADFINAAKPDFVGFVFARSRRQVSVDFAAELKERISGEIKSVGVFVDADIRGITACYRRGIIDIAQLHGNESGEYIDNLKSEGIPVIKAVRAELKQNIMRAEELFASADYLLFDNGAGGGGRAFDWNNMMGADIKKPFFLAGGISLDNIGGALNVRPAPYAVDISGGVETSGKKDGEKILKIVEYARLYGRQ
ncbi:MAG: phosphoribosylanthranilate isomerase [Clostridiales bacterium]|jgi:phosphoribosylanthranilate isomerase|nr:phosphoribosylanthranilate isomerase [Clostridiales bacterium]